MANGNIIGEAYGGIEGIAKAMGFKNSQEMAKKVNHENRIIAKHYGDIRKLMEEMLTPNAVKEATLTPAQGANLKQVA